MKKDGRRCDVNSELESPLEILAKRQESIFVILSNLVELAGRQRCDPEDVHHRLEEDEGNPSVAGGELAQCPEGPAVPRRVRAGVPPVVIAAVEGDRDARE